MKKFYSIVLTAMVLLFSIGMNAEVRTAGTVAELQSAIAAAEDGDEIQLTADINYSTGNTVACSVSKNVTIDGQGHTISGSGKCVFLVEGTSAKHVTAAVFKNLKLNNSTGRVFQLYDYLDRVDIDNCELSSQGASSIGGTNPEVITPWSATGQFELNLTNTRILATASGYPIITHCPLKINANNSYFAGFCGLYFKSGSAGSIVNADACNFDAPNIHSGQSNSFAVFPMEDTPLTFNLNNCGMNAKQLGDQGQPVFSLSEWTKDADRTGQVNITISGDNTYINCDTEWLWNSFWWNNPSGKPQYGSNSAPTITTAEAAVHVNVNAQVTGGTYSADPREMIYWNDQYKDGEGYHYNLGHITIPEGYEVKEINTIQDGVETTLYRVRKAITTAYSINDDVEGEGEGQNESTEFKISADEAVTAESTVANYVEVSSDATLTVGEDKTLEVTNGLDVAAGSQVVVETGGTLIVGEGGVITGDAEGIVIETSQDQPASFIMDPSVIINTTPNLTVKMVAKVGHVQGEEDWYWHRFAMPVSSITALPREKKDGNSVITYFEGWDYVENEWKVIKSFGEFVPFLGYTLTYDEPYNDLTDEGTTVTYTFSGNLVGNQNRTLNFQHKGYNYFGNSYTGYIETKTLLKEILGLENDDDVINSNIDGTVYLSQGVSTNGYSPLTWKNIRENNYPQAWMKEIAPMQTFVLQLRGAETAEAGINYNNAIWSNPRYGRVASAPARKVESTDNMSAFITISNGKSSDMLQIAENSDYSDEYENGADASKMMNGKGVNLFASVAGENLAAVVTDNLEGKMISVKAAKAGQYTMTFSNVRGEEFALKDMLTGAVVAINENSVYEFIADENTLNENRFMIVRRANMPTDVETVAAAAAQKGIYTVMGQYVGETEMFNSLPAGVYVVDGIKVVK